MVDLLAVGAVMWVLAVTLGRGSIAATDGWEIADLVEVAHTVSN